ncbi:MAG: sigma-70 family RNA polymerase sigma factor [Bacteroidia bacterium]|nr:sigma-70 family RNA polymerase sigma factor [Bacteroidia bacterium]
MSVKLKDKSDEELLNSFKAEGNSQALGELFKRYSLMCFSVAHKYLKNEALAEDACMQIFEQLLLTLHKHEVNNFRSWLYTTTKNYCLMQLRKPQLMQLLEHEPDDYENEFMENAAFVHPINEIPDLEEKLQSLEKAILGLNPKQQTCIRLFYLERLSYEDICKQTGFNFNEVKSAIQNAKRNLKMSLAEMGIHYVLISLLWMQQSA